MRYITSFAPFRRGHLVSSMSVAAAGALVLALCAGVDGRYGDSTQQTPTVPTHITWSPAAVHPVSPLGQPTLHPKHRPAPAPYRLMVSGVRVGSHPGFDRVVFDLVGQGHPGWYVRYTTTPAQQGSGHPVPYRGATALQVGIEGTPYPFELGMDFPDHGTVTGSGNVTEVIFSSLYEGRTEFVIGVADELPYSVTVLEQPPRLIVDIVSH